MKRLPLDEVDIYSGTQTRVATSDEAVNSYSEAMKQGIEFPPIAVYFDGSKYYLADGFHRFLAAKRNEDPDIAAEVTEGSRTDALVHALGANATNGVFRTNADKRNAAEIALEEWPEHSNAYIADICKVSIELIRRVRKSLGLDSPNLVLGKDGKKYPATRQGNKERVKDIMDEARADGGSGGSAGGGGGKPSKKNANYVDLAGGSNTELENEAREMIRKGEMDPRELRSIPTALPTDYAIAAINLLDKMDREDSRYQDALDRLGRWLDGRRAEVMVS